MNLKVWSFIAIVLLILFFRHIRKLDNKEVGDSTSGCLAFVSLGLLYFGLGMIESGNPLRATGIIMTIIFLLLTILFSMVFLFVHAEKEEDKESEEVTIPISFTITTVDDKKREEKQPKEEDIIPFAAKISRTLFNEIISCAADIKNLIKKICVKKEVFDAVNENSKEIGGDEMPNRIYFGKVLKR